MRREIFRRVWIALAMAWLAIGPLSSGVKGDDVPRRPNILMAIADDWSRADAGAYGCSWVRTPAFDRVAREGVLFANAFTNNPKCSPCRASLLTGRNTWQLEEAMCHFGLFRHKWPVYPDLFEEAGYLVGYTGKGWGPGDHESGGFERNPAGPAFNRYKAEPPRRAMSNNDYARNFAAFLEARKPGQPFCFWYGGQEPHRAYEEGAGLRAGRDPSEVVVPPYYPNAPAIRSDLLDYALEVEHFDDHLGRMIAQLDASGELDNTIVLVTSDHGMPFPRIKGQIYEAGFHLPLAVRWGSAIQGGRKVDDFVNVRDIAPTFLEAAGLEVPDPMTGRSFLEALRAEGSGWVDRTRNRMVVGKERHDLGRPDDQGYPVRAIRTPDYLYVRNYEPERWPVGDPETGYNNCDNSPTKTLITSRFDDHYRLCFGLRPAEELYRVADDPDCMTNLASDPDLATIKDKLGEEMEALLREDEDPRILGNGSIFESYKYVGARQHSYDAWLEHRR